jgi:diguanylate cyclase (GGDEF)-like protein
MRPHPRPLEGAGVTRRIAPFVAVGVLAFGVLPLLPGGAEASKLFAALALVPPLVLSAYVVPWERLPAWCQAVPPLVYYVVVALLRDGHFSGLVFTPLVLLPVFWFALHGTRAQLAAAIATLAATLTAPIVLVGTPHYPESEWARASIMILFGALVGYAVHTLVRQRGELLQRVSELALTDPLTGLPNRRAWEEELTRAIARAERWKSPLCLAIIDLDRFKEFNDARGHPRGDLLLKEAAAAWRTRLREVDFLARYGGEEFAVILPECELDQAVEVIDRVRIVTPGEQTSSSGVACWNGAETPDSVLLRADLALYAAKKSGRNQTVAAPFQADVTTES